MNTKSGWNFALQRRSLELAAVCQFQSVGCAILQNHKLKLSLSPFLKWISYMVHIIKLGGKVQIYFTELNAIKSQTTRFSKEGSLTWLTFLFGSKGYSGCLEIIQAVP